MSNILQNIYIVRYSQYLQQRKETQQEILAVFEQKEISKKQKLNIPYKLKVCLVKWNLIDSDLLTTLTEMEVLDRDTVSAFLDQIKLELMQTGRRLVDRSENMLVKKKRGKLCLASTSGQ